MKVVRQARLELSGGSTPDQLRPPSPRGRDVTKQWLDHTIYYHPHHPTPPLFHIPLPPPPPPPPPTPPAAERDQPPHSTRATLDAGAPNQDPSSALSGTAAGPSPGVSTALTVMSGPLSLGSPCATPLLRCSTIVSATAAPTASASATTTATATAAAATTAAAAAPACVPIPLINRGWWNERSYQLNTEQRMS